MDSPTTTPRVSVVIPAYNAEGCITRAIRSVQAQTEQDFEIVIVDDASTDGTVEVVNRLIEEDGRIKLVLSAQNGGPSIARNAGFAAATGKWIAILDADDAYKPERLKTLCDLADEHGLDAIGDDLIYYDQYANLEVKNGNYVPVDGLMPISLDDYLDTTTYHIGVREALYRDERQISLLKLVFRRDFVEKQSLRYTNKYRYCEDFLFYFDALKDGAKAALYNRPMYIYTERFGSVSRTLSPYSRTVSDKASIIEAVDEIFARHQDLTPNQKRLLRVRRQALVSIMKYERLRVSERKKGLAPLLMSVAKSPDLWLLFFREVRMAISTRVRHMFFQGSSVLRQP